MHPIHQNRSLVYITLCYATATLLGLIVVFNCSSAYAEDDTKIVHAKTFILNFISHPDTVKFHDHSISVNKDIVTITITYTNGIGVTQDMSMNINTADLKN